GGDGTAVKRRLLFVHAHPDDESSKGAATAARYVDEGAEVVLVTCTGGEAGEVLNPAMEPVADEEMTFVRQAELEAAVAILGFTDTYQLGYRDSGYHEDPDAVPDGTFARTPIDEPAGRLAEIIGEVRPEVVVTYPEDGGYPHPDHIMVHEVTMRALELAEASQTSPWRVPKVYACTAFPADRVVALHTAMLERDLESPFEGWMERRAERREATDEVDACIEVGKWFERRDEALLAHATQIDPDGFWFAVPRELEREVFPFECYHLLRSDVTTEPPEHDLFAGL
ncbi:MAG: mycothiol conjugate amidase Mca, partial [Nitriliruptorales bacterium]|nr:mycothiol conjugate amidase Mca [Nitriliruptorales bacterium]